MSQELSPQQLRQRMQRRKRLDVASALLYILPAAAIVFTFRLVPILAAFTFSFFEIKMGALVGYVGLGHYLKLFQDPTFWHSLSTTLWFVLGTVPPAIFASLFFAMLLNQKIRALGLYRMIYFIPVVTSMVAVAVIWKWILEPEIGILNYLLEGLGAGRLGWLSESRGIFQMMAGSIGINLPDWAGGPSLALISLALVNTWKGLGYNIVIFLAGLQNIPQQQYEAARIDGAGSWQLFRYVTWPMLSPTTFYVFIMSTIVSFQTFSLVYLMTSPPGGPEDSTKVLVYYLFDKGFTPPASLGRASAVALVLFIIILTLTIVQRRVAEKRVHY
ncbi:sugar ABC transporter permease [bacterium]|nr:sugar ABC transporter permease [bacterium]